MSVAQPATAASVLSTVHISNYRVFKRLEIRDLGRVNLFVGKNNAGKTSILEAVELLASGTPWSLWRSLTRRGEEFLRPSEDIKVREYDPSHLFHGHSIHPGAAFSITGRQRPAMVSCRVIESELNATDLRQRTLPDLEPIGPSFALLFESDLFPASVTIPLTLHGALPFDARRRLAISPPDGAPPVQFLQPDAPETIRLTSLWEAVVLTPEEQKVVEALQIIEPRLERIAFLGEERRYNKSVFLKLSGSDERLPLGSVGDGLKRLLALSLNLITARNGYLFVDEIDTGLHFSVMEDMWKLVIETSKRLGLQVFATTHSLDCVRSLAWVHQTLGLSAADVTLHRVEHDLDRTVTYKPEELAVAARHHVEVR